jgi:hypothetical protein
MWTYEIRNYWIISDRNKDLRFFTAPYQAIAEAAKSKILICSACG